MEGILPIREDVFCFLGFYYVKLQKLTLRKDRGIMAYLHIMGILT